MPQDLAALLVEEGAVSKADMDRALARQAQAGGAIDTALLELGLIGEGHLLSFLARATGLPAAPVEAFKDLDPRARRVFPAKVAERHRLAPLALDGRELSVVGAFPVDAAAVDEIGFMLSLTLVPHVAVEWRVRDLIHRLYGGPLPPRLAKLADAALLAAAASEAPPPPAPVAAAPDASASQPSAVEEAFFAAGDAGTYGAAPAVEPAAEAEAEPPAAAAVEPSAPAEPEEAPLPAAPPEAKAVATADGTPPASDEDEASFADLEPPRPALTGFAREEGEPAEPLLAALEQAVDAYDALWGDADRAAKAGKVAEGAAAGEAAEPPSDAAGAEGEAEPAEEGEPEPEEPPGEIDRSAPPRWSIDDARTALAAVRHRDEVVVTALRYARDFFEYAALFAVTRDAVVGHDALGPQEDERSHCRGTAIYANDPGIIRTALETHAPYLGPAVRDAVGTTNVLDGLWRGTPRTVLLYPILVGDRPVAVLYADNGEAPVSPRRLGDLLLFLSTVGGNFERIIRSRKKRRRRPPKAAAPPPPPPAPDPDPEPSPSWMEPPPDAPPPVAVPAHSAPAVATPTARAMTPPPAAAPAADPEPGPREPQPQPAAPAPSLEPAPAAPPAPSPDAIAPALSPTAARVEAAMAALRAGDRGAADRAPAIVDLVLDADPEVAEAAVAALAASREDPAVRQVPERLRRALLSGVGDRPALAARALGELRDVDSIPILIQALEGSSPQAAADALTAITLQRLGTNAQKWLKWWKENRGRKRPEWLFAALTSPERELRVAAEFELRAVAEPPVRYGADMPAAELEAAARAWWVWWSRRGA